MDIARLALRLAAIEQLAPSDRPPDAPWPTLAGPLVFDSRIAPVDQRHIAEKQPMIGVFTDDDDADPYGTGVDVLDEADATVTLSFEITVPMRLPSEDAGPGDLVLYGVTDAQIEARLDLIGAQIMQALRNGRFAGPLVPVLKSVRKRVSHIYRDADTDSRLSARRIDLTVGIKDPALPGEETAAGLDRLPEPLRSVANRLPAGSYGRIICETLAAAAPYGMTLPALSEMPFTAWFSKDEPVPSEPDLSGSINVT